VIELAAVIFSHATRESPALPPVNKNMNLFMDRLIAALHQLMLCAKGGSDTGSGKPPY
jgi:hypothetical protein